MNGLACELVSLYEMEIVEWQDSMLNHMAAIHESKTGKGKKVRGFRGFRSYIVCIPVPLCLGSKTKSWLFFLLFVCSSCFSSGMGFFSHHRHSSEAEKAEPTHRKKIYRATRPTWLFLHHHHTACSHQAPILVAPELSPYPLRQIITFTSKHHLGEKHLW